MSALPTISVWQVSTLGEVPGHLGLEVEVTTEEGRVVLLPSRQPDTQRLVWSTQALVPAEPVKHYRLVLIALRAERLALADHEVQVALRSVGVEL